MTQDTRRPFVEPTLIEEGSLSQVTLVSTGGDGGGDADTGVPT
jgi:hypothetical protein